MRKSNDKSSINGYLEKWLVILCWYLFLAVELIRGNPSSNLYRTFRCQPEILSSLWILFIDHCHHQTSIIFVLGRSILSSDIIRTLCSSFRWTILPLPIDELWLSNSIWGEKLSLINRMPNRINISHLDWRTLFAIRWSRHWCDRSSLTLNDLEEDFEIIGPKQKRKIIRARNRIIERVMHWSSMFIQSISRSTLDRWKRIHIHLRFLCEFTEFFSPSHLSSFDSHHRAEWTSFYSLTKDRFDWLEHEIVSAVILWQMNIYHWKTANKSHFHIFGLKVRWWLPLKHLFRLDKFDLPSE